MTASVRLFSYAGVSAITWATNNQLATNAAYVFQEPYLGSAAITASGTAQTVSSVAPANSRVLRIEVQKGSVIHYEISRPGVSATVATTNSPTIEGKENCDWGPNYQISILLAGGEA
jgi:hypothetical protein